MITVVVGKEIEKIKGDYESYLNGLNMTGAISYSLYSQLYDEGTKQIQKAYDLGKSELETELAKRAEQIEALNKDKDYFSNALDKQIEATYKVVEKLNEVKEIIQHFVDECKMCRAYPEKYKMWYQEIEKAEAFLKEEENV